MSLSVEKDDSIAFFISLCLESWEFDIDFEQVSLIVDGDYHAAFFGRADSYTDILNCDQ